MCKGLMATWIQFPSCFLESNLGKFLARFFENFLYLQINYSLFLQYMPSICLHNCKGIYFWQVIRSLCSMVMPNSCLYPTLFTALTLARSCSYESLYAPLNLITLYPDIQHSPCLTQPCSKGCVRSILFHNCSSPVFCHEFQDLYFVKCSVVFAFSLPLDLLISSGHAYKLTFRCSLTPSHHLVVH